MHRITSSLVLATLLFPAALHAQTSSGSPIEPQDQRIELSLADLLRIDGELRSLDIARGLPEKLFTRLDIVYLNRDGKTVFDFVLAEAAGKEMQEEGAGEATKQLQDLHLRFVKKFLSKQPQNSPDQSGAKYLATPDTPARKAVRDWWATRTEGDFLTLVRFERDKNTYVYATVDDGGARFNPDAPQP